MNANDLDELDFGVIGFDTAGIVRAFNAHESRASGIRGGRVVGRPLFTEVAPCMNNYMVAQQFVDAAFAGRILDTTIDFVLTLRMKPTPVRLRLIDAPGDPLAHVLVNRRRSR